MSEENDVLNVPTIDVSQLPSRFATYPEGASISYVPYKFGDLSSLNQSKLTLQTKIREVLKGIHTSFDKEQLTYNDFIYLALLRKLSTPGVNKHGAAFECPTCGTPNKITFKVTDLEFDDLEFPKGEHAIVALESEQELHFMPLTVKGFIDSCDAGHDRTNDSVALAIQVTNMPFNEALKCITGVINFNDIQQLQDIDKLLFHGVKDKQSQCSGKVKNNDGTSQPCEQLINVPLDGSGDVLIFPFLEHTETQRNPIRFSV